MTLGVDLAKLNALQTRGPIATNSTLVGLRGSAFTTRLTIGGVQNTGASDSTRGGTQFTIGSCSQ